MQGAENVWRYEVDKGLIKTIQPLPKKGQPKLRFNWNTPMAISVHQPDRFYMGSQFLHRSEDRGESWETISPDLTTNDPAKQNQADSGGLSMDNSGAENHTTIFTITESPLDENIIWVGTDDGNVQLTQDGGKTWINTTPNIEGLPRFTWAYHIEASVHDKGTAYVVFEGHSTGDMTPYVYKTTDFGAHWKNIATDEIKTFARNLQEDYINPDLLFLGTEMGLYITNDGGQSWSPFTNNMPPVAVHYIALQKRTNDLVMGTHGRGVIIIDDISPLRQITPENLDTKLHFFAPKGLLMKDSGDGFVGRPAQRKGVVVQVGRASRSRRRAFLRDVAGEAPEALQETMRTVDTTRGPLDIPLWRCIGQHEPSRCIRTVGADNAVRIDDILFRFRHGFDGADRHWRPS